VSRLSREDVTLIKPTVMSTFRMRGLLTMSIPVVTPYPGKTETTPGGTAAQKKIGLSEFQMNLSRTSSFLSHLREFQNCYRRQLKIPLLKE
jgi:hypothetical protein